MRLLLRLLFALSMLALPGATVARTIVATLPISRMDLPWWRERFEAKQVELRERHPRLIFLGDSITQNWERHGPPDWADDAPVWQRFYGDRDAVNLGFIGDTTASLIWRIRNGELDGISPKVVVVLIGANNLGRLHWSAEDTVAGIDTIMAELRRRLPRTKVDPARGAAASHRAGDGADGRGDGADARRAAGGPKPSCAAVGRKSHAPGLDPGDSVFRLCPDGGMRFAFPPYRFPFSPTLRSTVPTPAWRTPACSRPDRRCRSPA